MYSSAHDAICFFVVVITFSIVLFGVSVFFHIFANRINDGTIMKQLEESDTMIASEPAALYYGTSQELRDSGILPELKQFGKEDTLWIIRYLQRHLDELTASERPTLPDPLATLSQLGDLIRATGKTSEQLISEHLEEKYAV